LEPCMFIQIIRLISLLLALVALPARAWVTQPMLDPIHPKEGDVVYVTTSSGHCDAWGEPTVSREGNAVKLNIFSLMAINDEACIYDTSHERYPIGFFKAGRYFVQVERTYLGYEGLETHAMANFDLIVALPSSLSIPTLGPAGLVVLTAVLVAAGLWRRRTILRLAVILCVAIWPALPARAETQSPTIEVLLATGPGLLTAQQVVDQFRLASPGGTAPIPGLSSGDPDVVAYLMPVRANGDFLAWIQASPNTSRARLERYIVVIYPLGTDLQEPLAALLADPNVEGADIVQDVSFLSTAVGNDMNVFTSLAYSQYGWDGLNIASTWQRAGGYALIGDVDSGLAVEHPSFRQFDDAGNYVGGNFVAASSLDIGESYTVDPPTKIFANVDEARPIQTAFLACDPQQTGYAIPYFAGHGTHTAGLIAANPGGPTKGTCMHCGIAMWKIANYSCDPYSGHLRSSINAPALGAAIAYLGDSGAQVINMSFGSPNKGAGWCAMVDPKKPDSWCDSIAYVRSRGLTLVGASGNQRDALQFPANDERVISVGGIDSNFALWDESPGSIANCPVAPNLTLGKECGSNYTKDPSGPRQELMASSKSVLSTTYPGKDWNPALACGDNFGPGNGYGLCTGTSMAAPQIAGLVGILRSINPLISDGNPGFGFGNASGVRSVLSQHLWEPHVGYGVPDGAIAAERTLGHVADNVVKNRATPLFRLYSAGAKDYLDTVSPQFAIATVINQISAYAPQGALIPGYTAFPQDDNAAPFPTPRANVYVLTTEYSPQPNWPNVVPLYMVERTRSYPPECNGSPPACNPNNRDFTLLTTTPQIEQAHADGYSLRTIQGYIYAPCMPEPSCIPPGAQKFYRECKIADDDCATFLENERTAFEAGGYTAAYPANASKLMGYAYPAIDSDGDGLVDGFEYVVGTSPGMPDSDGDGLSDFAEFPMAGMAIADPCSGAAGGNCAGEVIFRNGFQ
jgi:serine protease